MNIVLSGVGGQGIVLASKLIARAAMNSGKRVRTAETIGMAQRGGCVVSHVRVGEAFSPMVAHGCADTVIGFEPFEAARALIYLKEGGTVVVSDRAIAAVTASLSGKTMDGGAMLDYLRARANTVVVNARAVEEACGTDKALNVVLLGAAARANALPVTLSQLEDAVRAAVKPKFVDMNLKALRLTDITY